MGPASVERHPLFSFAVAVQPWAGMHQRRVGRGQGRSLAVGPDSREPKGSTWLGAVLRLRVAVRLVGAPYSTVGRAKVACRREVACRRGEEHTAAAAAEGALLSTGAAPSSSSWQNWAPN